MKQKRKFSMNLILYTLAAAIVIMILIYMLPHPIKASMLEYKFVSGKLELFSKDVKKPLGLALNDEGKLFVHSVSDGKIVIINKDGKAQDYSYLDDIYSYEIDMDEHGNFLVATLDKVIVLNPFGTVIRTIPGFKRLYDIKGGPDGSIFVSDSDRNIIYKITKEDEVLEFFKFEELKSDSIPNAAGLSFDKDYKYLYVVNMYKGDLYRISISEDYKAVDSDIIASNLKRPNYVAVDERGNVYITCVGDSTIAKVDENCIVEKLDTKGKLSLPAGIAISQSDDKTLYVANIDSDSIYKLNLYNHVNKK